jgi:hypothetical protein
MSLKPAATAAVYFAFLFKHDIRGNGDDPDHDRVVPEVQSYPNELEPEPLLGVVDVGSSAHADA